MCTPDQTINVGENLSHAPEVPVLSGKGKVQWTDTAHAAFTIVIPDPEPGVDPPYSGKPYPNYRKDNNWTWSSCALAHGSTFSIPYSITFTQSNKKIYGHIIIRPLEK